MSTTNDTTTRPRRPGGSASRWLIPGVAVLIGVAYLVAGLLGDDASFGVGGLVVMLAVAAVVLLLGRRSETVAGLIDRNDERINQLDTGATVFAGMVLILAVLAMFVVEVAQGQDGSPYYQLGALAGVAYVVGLVYQRVRH